ncbi:MAG: hypothetical protein Q4D81_05210 [Eubacteriales bacterium]|nr:hypothetical protein [Eubacteriales bacterium]
MSEKEQQQKIFRKKTLDRISSPEQLTETLRVTGVGIWAVLAAVILFLAGLFAWAAIGTLETKAEAKVVVQGNSAQVITVGQQSMEAGMPLRVSEVETKIISANTDEYGRSVGYADVPLPDGIYDGTVVVEQTHPIEFLTGKK